MKNLFGLGTKEITAELMPLNLPKYRGKQIAAWLYKKGAKDFAAMTELPQNLRKKLAENFSIDRGNCEAELLSADGLTAKFLLKFADGVAVETVAMRHDYGNSLCISSQAGCNMGCAFCASALHGLTRNLTAGEMLAQAMFIDEYWRKRSRGEAGERQIDHLVIMGSGEPLLNYENVIKFLHLIHAAEGLNFGFRRLTISTSGVVPRIYDLAQEKLPVTLAISLHASNNELRSRLMPVNRRFPLAQLMAAGKYYGDVTGRRVTYEYILIENLNDSLIQARELCELLKGQLASVNLIPVNPVPERGFQRPSPKRVRDFAAYLRQHRISATVRKEMGADIAAACGQLRNRFLR